jgi:hypothetical protein
MPETLTAGHGPPKGNATVDALIGEFIAEKKLEQQEVSKGDAIRRRRRGMWTAAVAALAVAAWTVPVGTQQASEAAPPGLTLASARMTISLAASRIEGYRGLNGRLPTSLQEAGVEEEGLQLTRAGDGSFTLQLMSEAGALSFDSSMAPAMMLDAAAPVVARTGR